MVTAKLELVPTVASLLVVPQSTRSMCGSNLPAKNFVNVTNFTCKFRKKNATNSSEILCHFLNKK